MMAAASTPLADRAAGRVYDRSELAGHFPQKYTSFSWLVFTACSYCDTGTDACQEKPDRRV